MQLEPAQYYYPASDLSDGLIVDFLLFRLCFLSQIDTAAYVELVQQVIKNTGPFRLHFQGITASPSVCWCRAFLMIKS